MFSQILQGFLNLVGLILNSHKTFKMGSDFNTYKFLKTLQEK